MTPMQQVDELLEALSPYTLLEELTYRLPKVEIMTVLSQIAVDYELDEDDD